MPFAAKSPVRWQRFHRKRPISGDALTTKIGFGGGCHWCTEAVFSVLHGVDCVEQGFIAASAPDDRYSEAVIVHFDPDKISTETLIEIHLRTHASTSNHKMRGKYRSAIYVFNEQQLTNVKSDLLTVTNQLDIAPVTQVLRFCSFKASDERYQNYFEKNADGPFCRSYIDPKFDFLRTKFRAQLRPDFQSADIAKGVEA